MSVSAPSVQAQFQTLNRQARADYLAGNREVAQQEYTSAYNLAQTTDDPSYFSDDLAYTQQILAGDSGAVADAQNQVQQLETAKRNAVPESAAGAFLGSLEQDAKDGKLLDTSKLPSWGALLGTTSLVALAVGAVAVVAGIVYFRIGR